MANKEHTFNYHILMKGPGTFRDLAEYVQEAVGCSFEEGIDFGRAIFDVRVMRIDISIRWSHFDNSDGIEFERYDYYIAFRPAAKYLLKGSHYRSFYEAFPLLLASNISEDLGYECAVVADLALLVQTFASGNPA